MAMKKGRVIASSLAVALMLSGAGYAAWTDSLTINNTVSTGEFNVRFNAASITKSEYMTATTTNTFDHNSKTLDVVVGNLYPGASANLKATFINDGTIPAQLSSLIVADDTTINVPTGKTRLLLANADKIKVVGTTVVTGSPTQSGTYNINTNLKDLQSALAAVLPRLEENGTVSFDLTLSLPADEVTGDQLENQFVAFKVTIDSKQHNVQ
jgi:predicted ribosomally synthesized peptide with SipW-like signal peptide